VGWRSPLSVVGSTDVPGRRQDACVKNKGFRPGVNAWAVSLRQGLTAHRACPSVRQVFGGSKGGGLVHYRRIPAVIMPALLPSNTSSTASGP